MQAPVVCVRIAETDHPVTFNLGRLIAIESALDVGLIDLARRLSAYMPATKDGAIDKASVESVTAASRLGFMARFIAACLDITTDQLGERAAIGALWDLFYRLALGFMAAVMDLQGRDAEDAAGKAAAAQAAGTAEGSGPGPGSSSASAAPSSTPSCPPSSPG